MKTFLSPRPVNPFRRLRDDDGAVAILVAAAALALFGIGALAVDIGHLYSVRRESQTSADLAALSGAQQLPSQRVLACVKAVDYLNDNKPGATDYGIASASCSSGGTADGKTVVISADGTTIDVKVPDQQVDIGLGAIFGFSKGYTAAGAKVEIRSPGRLLPFGLTICQTLGYVVLKANPGTTSDCASRANGDFGYLDIPRQGVTGVNTRLETNIDVGIDHSLAFFPPFPNGMPSFAKGTDCPTIGAPPAIIESTSPGNAPVEGSNCAEIATGNKAGEITNGLIEHSNGACDGRLTRIPIETTNANKLRYNTCTIDDTPFADFLSPGSTIAQATAASPGTGLLTAAILRNPNFFVVPVLYSEARPGNGKYPISQFRGFYLECFKGNKPVDPPGTCTQGKSGQITELQGYAFNLTALTASDANTGDTSIYYGGGTTVPVLVK